LLKNNIDRPLSAILSLNTIAHTVGAAGVGAQATRLFGEVYFGIISAILTLLILIFSEIIPKTMGARYWRNLSVFVSTAVHLTIFLMYPLVMVSVVFTRLFSKKRKPKITSREEISVLAKIARDEGVFGEKETRVIQNVLRLKNIRVAEIMTPRVVVAVADETMKLIDFPGNKSFLRFSRIPVFNDNIDNITGYVIRQSVFEHLEEGKGDMSLKDIKRDILIVPEGNHIFLVWEKLLERKEHIALVVDEYGGMEGIITMEDIIESLLGFEIIDERDTISDMQHYARERWEARQKKYRFLHWNEDPEKDAPETS
jgi:CBS domain containing-hemolysin-like protein